MKKSVLIGIAAVAVGAGLWLGLRERQDLTTEGTKEAKRSSGSSVSSSGAGSLNESIESVKSVDGLVYSEEKLSDTVKALLGLDGEEHSYNSLGNAIGKLSKELSTEDLAALRDLLTWPNDKFPEGMRPIEINAVKNDVLDRLLRQSVLPEGIGLQLVEMASNPENDPVWRDYCVQFMTPFYERFAAESIAHEAGSKDQSEESRESVDELSAVRDAMIAALDDRDSTIAGTSLIGLELLSRTHNEFDREAIVSSALDIASDETASSASRMTALRIASQTSAEQNDESKTSTADAARMLAQTGETVLLRSSAIVTLGEVGSKEDRELLQSYTTADNKQIAEAANMALEKMDSRNL